MPITVDIEVKGLIEVQKKLEQVLTDLHGAPMIEAMRDATLLVTRDAKILAPVDTGRLRASITPDVTQRGNDVVGIVGSNVVYAPYMELGTRPHFPPLAALETWARRHGMSAFQVALAIARKGTKARKFLQGAFEKNEGRIIDLLERAIGRIVEK